MLDFGMGHIFQIMHDLPCSISCVSILKDHDHGTNYSR